LVIAARSDAEYNFAPLGVQRAPLRLAVVRCEA
jgi:hypothetical protein